jgi:hypothetical protein
LAIARERTLNHPSGSEAKPIQAGTLLPNGSKKQDLRPLFGGAFLFGYHVVTVRFSRSREAGRLAASGSAGMSLVGH